MNTVEKILAIRIANLEIEKAQVQIALEAEIEQLKAEIERLNNEKEEKGGKK